jgi:glycerol-3-phosphate acyltransferase PlsY
MVEALAVTLGYFVGSVPFAFVLARRHGLDLRAVGSGNVGAANLLRATGRAAALTALSLDAGKGALAVLLAQRLVDAPGTPVAAGLAAVIGHVYPVWLRFRGGKGVATAGGAFAVLTPVAAVIAAAVFLASVWTTRFVSVGSLAAAVSLAVAAVAGDGQPVVAAGALAAALVIVHRHRGNIARLVAGTEQRIGDRL